MTIADQWSLVNDAKKTIPVDVEGLAAQLGVRVHDAFLSDDISGMIECENDSHVITLNSNHGETRRRFTLAHELGHFMLHRHLIGDGLDDDRVYRSTDVGKYHNTKVGPREETEANKFAVALLMPRKELERPENQGKSAGQLAAEFGVSEQAMKIRLGQT